MSKKIMMVGEPMGLFIAQDENPLERVNQFFAAVAGAELNVAIGLTRLGHNVGYLTKLGMDPFGKCIVNTMKEDGINTSLISFSETKATGFMLKSKVSSGHPEVYYFRHLIGIPIEDTEFRQPCYYATPFSQTFNLTILWINKKPGLGYGIADNSISQQINWYLFGDQSTWRSFNKNIAAQFEDD